MKKLVFLILSNIALAGFSQTILTTKFDTKPLQKNKESGYVFPDTNADLLKLKQIKIMKQSDERFVGLLLDSEENGLASFSINQLDKALFYHKLSEALRSIGADSTLAKKVTDSLKNLEPDLYTQFLEKKEDFANAIGLAGVMSLRKQVPVLVPTTAEDSMYADVKNIKDRLEVQSTKIQFQDGFIENIIVTGKINGTGDLLKFENYYPIPFSTRKDFRMLVTKFLRCKTAPLVKAVYFINLGYFLSYNQDLANDLKDYSPANQVVNIPSMTDEIKEVALYKDQTSKILEVKVFSDLKGTDSENPNGLIQLELSRKLNFLSNRLPFSGKKITFNKKKPFLRINKGNNLGNIGFFNYVTPQFALTKIEDNQKRLILNHIDTLTLAADTSKAITYASSINLLKHQIFNVGLDLSAILIDIPGLKSTFNFGMGLYFGRSALQDTIRERTADPAFPNDKTKFVFSPIKNNNVVNYGVNTFQYGPFVTWQIFPDRRFGLSATQRFIWFKALSNNFVQVRDSANYLGFVAKTDKKLIASSVYQNDKCLTSSEIFAFFSPNGDGNNKLFFRYRLNWDINNAKENFHQMQVGFSTTLSATKEFAKLKKSVVTE